MSEGMSEVAAVEKKTTRLTSDAVETLISKCLFTEEEAEGREMEDIAREAVLVFNVANNGVGFHPGRLEESREKIVALLNELPVNFREGSGGGGWSFVNAVLTRDGGEEEWGEHLHADMLVCLGLAIGRVRFCLPRELWSLLPNGAPFFVVTDEVRIDEDNVIPSGMSFAESQAIAPDMAFKLKQAQAVADRLQVENPATNEDIIKLIMKTLDELRQERESDSGTESGTESELEVTCD